MLAHHIVLNAHYHTLQSLGVEFQIGEYVDPESLQNLQGSNDIVGKPKRWRYDTVVVRLERLDAGDFGVAVQMDCCP